MAVGGAQFESGQAYVWQVQRNGAGPSFALKRLKNANRRERFAKEVKTTQALSELGLRVPAVVHSGLDELKPFFVMPWFDGGSLERAAISERRYQTMPDVALEILIDAGETLASIHQEGFAHRDLKPANILLDSSGRPVIADLGLCLEAEGSDNRLTGTDEAVGSRLYIAPENEHGLNPEVDQRPADFYAFGKIVWSVLSCRQPPAREDLLNAEHELASITGCAPLNELRPLLRRLLNTDPRARLSEWGDVLGVLRLVLNGLRGSREDASVRIPMSTLESVRRISNLPSVAHQRRLAARATETTELWNDVAGLVSRATHEVLQDALDQLSDGSDGGIYATLSNGGPEFATLPGRWPALSLALGADLLNYERELSVPSSLVVVAPTEIGPPVGAFYLKLFALQLAGQRVVLISVPLLARSREQPPDVGANDVVGRYIMISEQIDLNSLQARTTAVDFARHRAQWCLAAVGDYLNIVASERDVADPANW